MGLPGAQMTFSTPWVRYGVGVDIEANALPTSQTRKKIKVSVENMGGKKRRMHDVNIS